MAPLTTYRVGGSAALLVEPSGASDLRRLADVLAGLPEVRVLPLGRGSNVVVSDAGFDGVVVRLGTGFGGIDEAGHGEVVAGAATTMPQLANWAARRGMTGVEFGVAIPGSVGGAVRMNAGAHGREMKDALATARVLNLRGGDFTQVDATVLDLSYRHSGLSDSEIVVQATLTLARESVETVRTRMEEYRKHRAATQPGAVQNAGSVFKNPPGDAAGRLVESCGLKGFAVGGASVSDLHANFFIASDAATAQDVHDLVASVRARVADQTGVELEPEIRFVGSFENAAPGVFDGVTQ
jgi:UDP-N-acetylmuramate dehydrogenase